MFAFGTTALNSSRCYPPAAHFWINNSTAFTFVNFSDGCGRSVCVDVAPTRAWHLIGNEWKGDELFFATEREAWDRADYVARILPGVVDMRAVKVDEVPDAVTHRWEGGYLIPT